MKFSPGEVVVTAGVDSMMNENEEFRLFVMDGLRRHMSCDWGDIHPGDVGMNEEALEVGNRIFSVYKHETLPTIWWITESDRSVTTGLFPDEY